MHLNEIPNRGRKPTLLIRESYREGTQVKKRTVANVTHLPANVVDAIRRTLSNEVLVRPGDAFRIVRCRQHGHVEAVCVGSEKSGVNGY